MFESKLVEKEPHNKGCMSRGLAVARALQLLELKPKGKGHADRVGDGGGVPGDGSLPIQTKHLQHWMVKPRVKTRIEEEQRSQDRGGRQWSAELMSLKKVEDPLQKGTNFYNQAFISRILRMKTNKKGTNFYNQGSILEEDPEYQLIVDCGMGASLIFTCLINCQDKYLLQCQRYHKFVEYLRRENQQQSLPYRMP
ncbi:unnamed protein product [Miscanthus lutarioriparius]|uniref:Uncharacterized protein n=1 Tax=Miscanthus lutarioriparius TaxID=422564 RepID=A0A811QLZ2_9POAL|nr:unnamed protein product [Miscanthus lutarioriparius]